MTDKRTMAIGIGALLLLVNLGLIVTGFVVGRLRALLKVLLPMEWTEWTMMATWITPMTMTTIG